ncbi:MAG TPA: right-handed parallel beta-helix repeat-containing protein [Nevskiaceae bacterium]|nr:right-handed parallel beta-helix repeat-containing protein [Nevskiaceae bacterium]
MAVHHTAPKTKTKLRHNLRPSLLLIVLPLLGGIAIVVFFASGAYGKTLARAGNTRLVTENWEAADNAFTSRTPVYERKYAYYKLKDGQNLASVAAYFSVDEQKLAALNPGDIVPGTTVKVPPVEHPLAPIAGPNGGLSTAAITNDRGLLRIRQNYKFATATTTIPDLMNFLKPYNAIVQTGPKTFRLERAISLEGNIRLDITNDTAEKLELRSEPNVPNCLCMDQASALIKNTTITSYVPGTNQPDKNYKDGRAFVRDKNGRMDTINVNFSYLGTALKKPSSPIPPESEGGIYGVSWRISDDMLGAEIATGWVEHSSFTHNHFGAFTFGASGMLWRNSYFAYNDVYGLDPHDDSNNALVEGNVFAYNHKHGFIVSKRCDYNIIRNNLSIGNDLHGYMLHQDSAYNLIENNIAYDNTDNYVIYESDYNTIRNNVGYNARSSNVRINEKSRNNYVINNKFLGGRRGVYVYGGAENVYVKNNTIHVRKEVLATNGAQNVLFANNTIDRLAYKIAKNDRLIFGPNTIAPSTVVNPSGNSLYQKAIQITPHN